MASGIIQGVLQPSASLLVYKTHLMAQLNIVKNDPLLCPMHEVSLKAPRLVENLYRGRLSPSAKSNFTHVLRATAMIPSPSACKPHRRTLSRSSHTSIHASCAGLSCRGTLRCASLSILGLSSDGPGRKFDPGSAFPQARSKAHPCAHAPTHPS